MRIERVSPVTGKTNTMDLDITEGQLLAWKGGLVIQKAMPHLTPDEREFLISGMTPEDWEATFGNEDDEPT
jgi:hypothetical protein